MDDILTWLKKHKVIAVIIAFLAFCGPLVIVHILFKYHPVNTFWIAAWTAGDVIGYIAGFEALVGTVMLGIVSISLAKQANTTNDKILNITRETERLAIIPYFSFNKYITRYIGSLDEIDDEQEQQMSFEPCKREDMLLDRLVYTIREKKITLANTLTEKQDKVLSRPYSVNKGEAGTVLTPIIQPYIKLFVQNCGNGAAINVQCRLFKCGYEHDEKLDLFSRLFCVPTTHKFDLEVFIECPPECAGKYTIQLQYQDIYANKYEQNILLEIMAERYTIDLNAEQVCCPAYEGV